MCNAPFEKRRIAMPRPGMSLPSVAEHRRYSSGFLNRFSNLLWNSVVIHVPNARDQAEDTVRNLRVKPAGLLGIDDTILRTRHDPEHRCFSLA